MGRKTADILVENSRNRIILQKAFVADNHCVGQTLVSHIGEEEEAEEEDETVIPRSRICSTAGITSRRRSSS